MMTSLQRLSLYNNSWRKFSLKKLIVIVLLFVVLISFTNYAYGITVGTVPIQIEINSITKKAYLTQSDGFVKVIDVNPANVLPIVDPPTYNTVIATIPVDPGKALLNPTVNEVTNTIYVTNSGSNSVAIIDGVTDSVTGTISLAPFGGVFPIDVETTTTKKAFSSI